MKKISVSVLCLLLVFVIPCIAHAESFTSRVQQVISGDTLIVLYRNCAVIVHIDGIDSPEIAQDYGKEACRILSDLVSEKEVWVDVQRHDHSGRLVSFVKCGDLDLALEMIKSGCAWSDPRTPRGKKLYYAEEEARKNRTGLWAGDNPIQPWIFRQHECGVIPEGMSSSELLSRRSGSRGSSHSDFGFISASSHRSSCSSYGGSPSGGGFAVLSGYGNSSSPPVKDDYSTVSTPISGYISAYGNTSARSSESGPVPAGSGVSGGNSGTSSTVRTSKSSVNSVKVIKSRKYVANTDYIRTEAYVSNTGRTTANNVTVICSFLNFFGEPFSSDKSRVSILEPGETKMVTFFSMVRAESRGLDTLSDTLTVITEENGIKKLVDVKVEFKVISE